MLLIIVRRIGGQFICFVVFLMSSAERNWLVIGFIKEDCSIRSRRSSTYGGRDEDLILLGATITYF